MVKNDGLLVKALSIFVSVFFLNYALITPLHAQSIYKDTRSVLEGTIYQENTDESSFEAKLKEIRRRQESGRAIFFTGVGLWSLWLASFFVGEERKANLTYFFGVPLVSIAIIWYGFGETVAANRDEAALKYQEIRINENKGKELEE